MGFLQGEPDGGDTAIDAGPWTCGAIDSKLLGEMRPAGSSMDGGNHNAYTSPEGALSENVEPGTGGAAETRVRGLAR